MEVFIDALTRIITFLSRFATQLIAAELLFLPVVQKRKFFWLRLVVALIVYTVIPYLLPGRIYNWSPLVFFGWLNLNWILIFLLAMAVFFLVFKVSVRHTFFYGTAAYAVQHLVRNFASFINTLANIHAGTIWYYLMIVGISVVFFPLFYFLFVRRLKNGEKSNLNNKYVFVFSVIIITIVLFLYIWAGHEGSTGFSTNLYASSCCILLLIIQFNLFEQGETLREKEEIERLLHSEQEFHAFSQKNIDLINIKCHDLKRQIAAIRAMDDAHSQREVLKELEDAVLIYDNIAKTGNKALDTLLTEKCLYCEKNEIKFSYLVDVAPLSILSDSDLFSLLGNALDNAIEGSLKLQDKEKRIISLMIDSKQGMLKIHMDNSYGGVLTFENGLPRTTKEDTRFHGYGIRSIQYITQKYGGTLFIHAEDNIFNLDIVIPIQ